VGRRVVPRRIAMLSVHTSPLEQPGTGDAGGLNVYVVETARRLAERGTEVEIFTRATSSDLPAIVPLAPGVLVRHIPAGPFEGLSKNDLPGLLCQFAAGVLRVEACHEPGWYDLVHSHYWLSGQVGWLAGDRWNVPLVHTMHTMAKVKNASLATGDAAEPLGRVFGEEQVVAAADRLLANTDDEARQLVGLYGADPRRVAVVPPGVDLSTFSPGGVGARRLARRRLGLPPDAELLLFVGRIQPLKAPDVLLEAAARLVARAPGRRSRLRVAVLGGPSGSGLDRPQELQQLAARLGIADLVCFHPPVSRPVLADWYRAADVVAVPSHNESFGLVAIEAQACGTPVVAAKVGGLRTAVAHGVSGLLVDGHEPAEWAATLGGLLDDDGRRHRMRSGAVAQARRFSWDATVDGTAEVYAGALADHRHRRLAALASAGAGAGAGAGARTRNALAVAP
jgi:D-inositol-3-phosphate glycosyltransferase